MKAFLIILTFVICSCSKHGIITAGTDVGGVFYDTTAKSSIWDNCFVGDTTPCFIDCDTSKSWGFIGESTPLRLTYGSLADSCKHKNK